MKFSTGIRIACTAWCCVVSTPTTAQNLAAGQAIAEKHCARCHAITTEQKSRHAVAPTFPVIANRYSVWGLQEALAEGIIVGHGEMPKYVFSPDEINDLLSFMDTFTHGKSKNR
jgi:mono/diheme cytochrome c family protein